MLHMIIPWQLLPHQPSGHSQVQSASKVPHCWQGGHVVVDVTMVVVDEVDVEDVVHGSGHGLGQGTVVKAVL